MTKQTLVKSVLALMTIAAATLRIPLASAMDASDVTIARRGKDSYWVMLSNDADAPDGLLVAANETVVDQLDSLDPKSEFHCKMKYRRALVFNAPTLQTLMVYGLDSCHK